MDIIPNIEKPIHTEYGIFVHATFRLIPTKDGGKTPILFARQYPKQGELMLDIESDIIKPCISDNAEQVGWLYSVLAVEEDFTEDQLYDIAHGEIKDEDEVMIACVREIKKAKLISASHVPEGIAPAVSFSVEDVAHIVRQPLSFVKTKTKTKYL